MISVFVYEFLSGGGTLNGVSASDPPESLLAEGRAMAEALAADFAKVSRVKRVTCLRDARQAGMPALVPQRQAGMPALLDQRQAGMPALLGLRGEGEPLHQDRRFIDVANGAEHAAAFDRLAAEADWTVVIAPEIGGALAERCRRVAAVGGRQLGPGQSLVELASDKQRTAEFLDRAGVPTPLGILHPTGEPWPCNFVYPAVWKPLDGAGSQGIVFVPNSDAPPLAPSGPCGRLERFCPGVPASVAFLCGPGGRRLALPACRQRLGNDGRFRYLGGELPLPPELALRAATIAERVVAALPGAFGYLGVDLVLGEAADGAEDVAIEINPRLTTSYLGLRAAVEENLAGAMLEVAQGLDPPPIIARRAVRFDADGRIRD